MAATGAAGRGYQLVISSKWLGYREAHGIRRETDLYELKLACGHTITRSESKAHVMCAKCPEGCR